MVEEKKHILVVDDDNRLRSLLGRFLREQAFTVSMASSADEAEMFLTQYRFELIVLDVMMPGRNGFEFLKKLREETLRACSSRQESF